MSMMSESTQSGSSARARNVIFIGDTGSGKSSIINLIAGDGLAAISSGVPACTTRITHYDVPLWGRTYRLWDTPGLNEASRFGFTFSTPASETLLKAFIRERYLKREIDLVVFCVRSGRSHKCMESAYKTFCKTTRRIAAPVVIAVTHLENMQPAMDTWWIQNGMKLERQGLVFDGHVCLTCLSPHPRRQSATEEIHDLLARNYRWQPHAEGPDPDFDFLKGEGRCVIS
ncbi:hypothetical protein BS17DRAFT_172839 [Gyrodon lividus]|nr:hypothetical protein BS17DRAFT_172839 [Gyrodon lividus]